MTFHIPEAHVQAAFEILRANEHSKARAAFEFADKHLKVVLAKAAAQSNATSVSQRENDALRSAEYERALSAYRDVVELYTFAKDRREAASALIEAWRTQQSDMRAMGRVA